MTPLKPGEHLRIGTSAFIDLPEVDVSISAYVAPQLKIDINPHSKTYRTQVANGLATTEVFVLDEHLQLVRYRLVTVIDPSVPAFNAVEQQFFNRGQVYDSLTDTGMMYLMLKNRAYRKDEFPARFLRLYNKAIADGGEVRIAVPKKPKKAEKLVARLGLKQGFEIVDIGEGNNGSRRYRLKAVSYDPLANVKGVIGTIRKEETPEEQPADTHELSVEELVEGLDAIVGTGKRKEILQPAVDLEVPNEEELIRLEETI